MSTRSYPVGVREALFMLSRGCCYEPDCREPVMRVINESWYVNVEIAHICAREPSGARHVKEMTSAARDSFDNLLLLCIPHHKVIDNRATRGNYNVALLHTWKREREGELGTQLRNWQGLNGLTDDRLQEILSDVVTAAKDEILEAIDKLAVINTDTAKLVRQLVDERFELPYLDTDAIGQLSEAAYTLRTLTDDASLLHHASEPLGGLRDSASLLLQAAEILETQRLSQSASTLMDAIVVTEPLQRITDDVRRLSEAMDRAERLTLPTSRSAEAFQTISDPTDPWLYFKWGLGLGVGAVLALVLLIVYLVHK